MSSTFHAHAVHCGQFHIEFTRNYDSKSFSSSTDNLVVLVGKSDFDEFEISQTIHYVDASSSLNWMGFDSRLLAKCDWSLLSQPGSRARANEQLNGLNGEWTNTDDMQPNGDGKKARQHVPRNHRRVGNTVVRAPNPMKKQTKHRGGNKGGPNPKNVAHNAKVSILLDGNGFPLQPLNDPRHLPHFRNERRQAALQARLQNLLDSGPGDDGQAYARIVNDLHQRLFRLRQATVPPPPGQQLPNPGPPGALPPAPQPPAVPIPLPGPQPLQPLPAPVPLVPAPLPGPPVPPVPVPPVPVVPVPVPNPGPPQPGQPVPANPAQPVPAINMPPVDPALQFEEDLEALRPVFREAANPNVRCLHHFDAEPHITTFFQQEPLGSPFCGLAAIDLATGNRYDLDVYATYVNGFNLLGGQTTAQLAEYACVRGVNLKIYQARYSVGPNNRRFLEAFDIQERRCHNPSWKTVMLAYDNPVVGDVGHFTLLATQQADLTMAQMPIFEPPEFWFWPCVAAFVLFIISLAVPDADGHFIGIALSLLTLSPFNVVPTLNYGPLRYSPSNEDRRPVIPARDPTERQDSYCDVSVCWRLRYGWENVIFLPTWIYTVSVQRFLEGYQEIQGCIVHGTKIDYALSSINAIRGVNTDPSIAHVFTATAEVLRLVIKYYPGPGRRPKINEQPGPCVGYNASAWEMVVSGAERQVISLRQNLAMRGGRLPDGSAAVLSNHVLHIDPWPKVKINRPVAVSFVRLWSDIGQVGPGFYPLTDPLNLLAAFTVRSMTARDKDRALLRDFVSFSKRFISGYVRGTIHKRSEPSCHSSYRKAQRKKNTSESEIDAVLQEYDNYRNGTRDKKFTEHGMFNKFEQSAKPRPDGSMGVKPRGIMTMSRLMAVECAPILDLIDDWNHGPFSKFQIKDVTPEEAMRRVIDMSFMRHSVSDYSSFEASIDQMVREVENHAMLEMCKRAGYVNTAAAIRRHAFGGRVLTFKGGKFKIFSRCSGDYWTSFGNGVVNVCIMAYCVYMSGRDPGLLRMIAEGDDGLVPACVPIRETIVALGFGFSTELSGNAPGDCDFLRSRWIGGKRYLNIGRCFNAFWIKKAARLKPNKQKFLMRCIANSLHHLSPGHPVVSAIVNRLLRESHGATRFKGYKKYLDTWGAKDYREIQGYTYEVDNSMRAEIARGAGEFPPLPVYAQLALEERILHDHEIYVGSILNSYPDFRALRASHSLLNERTIPHNHTDAVSLCRIFNIQVRGGQD